MKKLRYISIHQPWPFQLLVLPLNLEQSFVPLQHLCFKFQSEHEVTQSCSYNAAIYQISFLASTELLKYVITSVIKGRVCVWV